MEFDKSRCYSAINADELHEGDKVIVAGNVGTLKWSLNYERIETLYKEIVEIKGEDEPVRFVVKAYGHDSKTNDYALAYLVERAENCTNCGEGKWDAEHQKIHCDPIMCGNGNVVFRNHEIEVCEYWKPKTEDKWCKNCGVEVCSRAGVDADVRCPAWQPKAEKHTDYNHCEEARKAYACAMTNVCPNKHYRPFRDTDELIKVWDAKIGTPKWGTNGDLTMPHIWVKRKEAKTKGQLITEFGDEQHVSMGNEGYNMTDLFVHFTFLNGSVCGVEE